MANSTNGQATTLKPLVVGSNPAAATFSFAPYPAEKPHHSNFESLLSSGGEKLSSRYHRRTGFNLEILGYGSEFS